MGRREVRGVNIMYVECYTTHKRLTATLSVGGAGQPLPNNTSGFNFHKNIVCY